MGQIETNAMYAEVAWDCCKNLHQLGPGSKWRGLGILGTDSQVKGMSGS